MLCSVVVRIAIAPAVQSLVSADPHIRRDDDPEWIHAARVATRRLRTQLRLFAAIVDPEWLAGMRGELKRLADMLGAVRDVDVLHEHVATLGRRLPGDDAPAVERMLVDFRAAREDAQRALLAHMSESRYVELLERLVASVRDGPPMVIEDAEVAAADTVADLMREPWLRLTAELKHAKPGATMEQLHRVRIAAKRCRYAAEVAERLMSGDNRDRARRFVRRLGRLQDELGQHHDALVESSRLRRSEGADPFVAGELAGLEAALAESTRSAWRKTIGKVLNGDLHFWQ